MNPRGVTLVELLAAISILVVVTALALPALQNRMSAARLEAAQGQLQAAALATRAEAMRQGKSLTLTAHVASSKEVELLIAPLTQVDSSSGSGTRGKSDESRAVMGSKWAGLPASISLRAQPPALAEQTERANKEAASELRDVRLAAFCPDGSAVTTPVYMTDGESVVVVTVNPWIGGAKFAVYVAETRDAAGADQGEKEGKNGEPSESGNLPRPGAAKAPIAPTGNGGKR